VSISSLATVFVTRATRYSFIERPGTWVLIAFGIAQLAASLITAYGLGNLPGENVSIKTTICN
jgi:H+-transporting ATPase